MSTSQLVTSLVLDTSPNRVTRPHHYDKKTPPLAGRDTGPPPSENEHDFATGKNALTFSPLKPEASCETRLNEPISTLMLAPTIVEAPVVRQ